MQTQNEIEQARKGAGRINWGEYSKLTGTQIPKNAVPATVKPSPQVNKARRDADQFKRVNATEYARLTAKRPQRKATPRKRVAAK
jgi:hypothetical protein